MEQDFPARIHVLLSSQSSKAVVLRRGPSKTVCSVLWDRKLDKFEVGQWLKGRIYERRSDISPDGKYMIYFALNGKWDSETGGSWTAISRPPWLKAIVLLSKGDAWQGGGIFTGNNLYWLNDGCGHKLIHDNKEVHRDKKFVPDTYYGGECTGVYYIRLQRDGWKYKDHIRKGPWDEYTVFEKATPHGWTLRKIAHEQVGAPVGKGVYWDEHELEHSENNVILEFPNWEWADLDGESLVWAEKGCLYRAGINEKDGPLETRLLYDFNEMELEPLAAPY